MDDRAALQAQVPRRLEAVVERYGLVLHAYVLMDTHYHLLIEPPRANASRALQWLHLSYSVWHNVRHHRSGALFQARFKGIPVENEGAWALAAMGDVAMVARYS